MAMAVMNMRILSVWNFDCRDRERIVAAMRLMWIPGMSPVMIPAVIPVKKVRM